MFHLLRKDINLVAFVFQNFFFHSFVFFWVFESGQILCMNCGLANFLHEYIPVHRAEVLWRRVCHCHQNQYCSRQIGAIPVHLYVSTYRKGDGWQVIVALLLEVFANSNFAELKLWCFIREDSCHICFQLMVCKLEVALRMLPGSSCCIFLWVFNS